uniref:Uncharacterized protein n=1 Tax=Leptospira santarosai serovar Arenal str. MAVJ 401 TaxID=1049976 RepID=M6JJ40_9LEPT|nr:hypothetical protein LEP1GSC063_3678 [Leptospira santarosai serovar Arenal str. MAVJ 401]
MYNLFNKLVYLPFLLKTSLSIQLHTLSSIDWFTVFKSQKSRESW